MTENEYEIWKSGVKEGKEHSEPSAYTKEFMAEIKKSIEKNSEEHQEIKLCLGGFVSQERCNQNTNNLMDKIDDLTKQVLELPEKLIEKLDKKYASKRTETILYGVMGFIGLTLISIIAYLLDKFVIIK